VVLALAALTVVLLALSGWGFSRLVAESGAVTLTSGEARLTGSIMLNLVMFGYSLIGALGTAFLAGPTLAGETESGIALAVLARPIRRSAFLLGKWMGLVAFGSGFVVLAGLAQCLVVRQTVDYWPPEPAVALALLAAQTILLLTLAVLLSTVISPMASGVVTVGLFGATWIAGVVGGIGTALGNASVERVGTISRMLLPTDGLWRGAMHAFPGPVGARPDGRRRRRLPVPERGAADGHLPRVGRCVGGDGLGAGVGVLLAQGPVTDPVVTAGCSSRHQPGRVCCDLGPDPHTVGLRAERAGTGDGRVYRLAFTATDPAGASCSSQVAVGVPLERNGAVDSGGSYDSFVT
jgi:hypothetical protein